MFFYIFFIILFLIAAFCSLKISIIDFKRRIIPDIYLFPLLIIGLLTVNCFPYFISPEQSAIGAFWGYSISSITGFIYNYRLARHNKNAPNPIGMGDIKLISVGGIWLGATWMAFSLFIACITGMIWAHQNHQKMIPFAPFFVFGAILSLIINITFGII